MKVGVLEDSDADFHFIKEALVDANVERFKTLSDFTDSMGDWDFAIIDLSLPDSWGFDTIKSVAKDIKCPFIVLTGLGGEYLTDMTKASMKDAGALDVIGKGDLDKLRLLI